MINILLSADIIRLACDLFCHPVGSDSAPADSGSKFDDAQGPEATPPPSFPKELLHRTTMRATSSSSIYSFMHSTLMLLHHAPFFAREGAVE